MPRFATFDKASAWFEGGGELIAAAESAEALTRGRAQLLAFIVPVEAPAALDAVDALHDVVADLPGVQRQPDELLHITVRVAGFQVIAKRFEDELLPREVDGIAAAATKTLRASAPFRVTLGPGNVFPDALILEVHDGGELAALRERIASAARLAAETEPYLPHVTVATFRDASIAPALRERLAELRALAQVEMPVGRVDFVRAWFTGLEAEPPELDVVRSYVLRGSA